MTELERQLRALPVAVPDTPDLAPAVLVRLEGRPFPWRQAAVPSSVAGRPPTRTACSRPAWSPSGA